MPIFDFKCKECGHVYEWLIRNISSDPPVCFKCGATEETQTRQVSAPKLFNGLPMGNGKFDRMNSKKPPS